MSEEKLKVYLARDFKFGKQPTGHLWMYRQKPNFNKISRAFDGDNGATMRMPTGAFLEIKEGECYEAEIILGEKS